MFWLGLLKTIFGLAGALTSYLRDRQLLSAGEALAINKQLESSQNALKSAMEARRGAVSDFDANDGVPDDEDPNLRD